jgi:GT2 family glycosyltransferase
MMVSRTMIEKTGLMEESFFLYYEELDWCERAKKAGFTLYYVGQSTVYHKESISVGKNSPLKTYYLTRNRLLFARRNYNGFALWVSLLFFTLFSFPKAILYYMLRGKYSFIKAFLKGVLWHIYPPHDSCYLATSRKPTKTNKPTLIHT